MTYGYIYRTTCFPSGRVYIGQRGLPGFDPRYLGSGLRLKYAVKKYGRAAFLVEVLAFGETKEELDRLERRAIIEHRSLLGQEALYNITDGGEGKPHELSTREAIGARVQANSGARRASQEGRFWLKGTKWSLEKRTAVMAGRAIGKPCNRNKGKKASEETRRKMSESHKSRLADGSFFTDAIRTKISHGRKRYWEIMRLTGKRQNPPPPMSDLTKRKISETKKKTVADGFRLTHSPETRAKISAAQRLRYASGYRAEVSPSHRAKQSDSMKRYWAQKKGAVQI